jgi:Tol biopolymer transport system component
MHSESLRPWTCEESGAKITQLTSAAFIHHHIYPEAPVFTPDARYFVYDRFQSLDSPNHLWLCDLETGRLRQLTYEGAVRGPVMGPDGRWVVYVHTRGPKEFAVKRVSLETYACETVTVATGLRRPYALGTISPDGRWYVTGVWLPDGEFGLLRVDLQEQTHAVIHQDPEILNPHMQFEPLPG